MRRDALKTVIRVRELAERRRLAEQAQALRDAEAADAARDQADAAFTGAAVPAGDTTAVVLHSYRASIIALGEAVEDAEGTSAAAHQQVERAQQLTVEAAIERRSAERLEQRRDAAEAASVSREAQRRADETALQIWRRS